MFVHILILTSFKNLFLSKNFSIANHKLGFLFAALATLIWSGNFLVARGLNAEIDPVSLAFWRWTVASVLVFPLTIKSILGQRSILGRHLSYFLTVSILGVTVFNTLIYVGGQTSSALNLSLISITFPVFTIVLSRIFLREPITTRKIIGVAIIVTGVLLLITKGDLQMLLNLSFVEGDLWMLLASFIFAVYSLMVKQRPVEIKPLSFLGTTFLVGWIFLALMFFITTDRISLNSYGFKTISGILYIGIFASIIAYFLWNRSVDLIGPAQASMIYYLIPLFSGILAFFFLDEKVSMIHLISGTLILSGIWIATKQNASN